jgi:hypothetical protein
MPLIAALLASAFCVLATVWPATAEARRVALVIGNADYRIGRLQNTVNDADAMAEVLDKQLRFDKVILTKKSWC